MKKRKLAEVEVAVEMSVERAAAPRVLSRRSDTP